MKYPMATLVSLTAVLPLLSIATPQAQACTVVDTTQQVAIRGDRDTPAQQENETTAEVDDNCFNNHVVGNTTQTSIGADNIQQNNEGQYFLGGGEQNQTGLKTPTVIVTPETQVDVYSPAHDDEFLDHLRP